MIKNNKKNIYIAIIVALIVFAIDQASKLLTMYFLHQHGVIKLLPFCNIVFVWNYGISFGLGNNAMQNQLLLVFGALILVFCLYYLLYRHKKVDKYAVYAVGMIGGGAIGNVLDRLVWGAVFDFIDLHLFTYHWPAFNFADSAIVIGGLLWLIYYDYDAHSSKSGKSSRPHKNNRL